MVTQSESIKHIAAAMAKVQAEMKAATKDTNNEFFKSKYADLSECWRACREALTANGVAVIQGVVDGKMNTTLAHSSGEWMSDEGVPLCGYQSAKNPMQALGSAATYARRYGLCAMVGITPEDDDGNALTQDKPQADPRFVSEAEEKALTKLIKDYGANGTTLCEVYGVTAISEMTPDMAREATAKLHKKYAPAEAAE